MIPRGIVGTVHLPPLPGDPRHVEGDFAAVRDAALRDAQALAEAGVDGLVVENFGSAPFSKGTEGQRLPAHAVATLALVADECRRRYRVNVGVNCLRNDAISALGIAAAAGLDFIRVNIHLGTYVTDQGIVEGEAATSLRHRRALGATRVAVCADVLVKHASPFVPFDPHAAVRECFERGGADAVVISGAATGEAATVERLMRAREAAGDGALLIGSGLTPDNAATLAPYADGAIVGTWLKQRGDVHAPVDPDRAHRLVEAARPLLRMPA